MHLQYPRTQHICLELLWNIGEKNWPSLFKKLPVECWLPDQRYTSSRIGKWWLTTQLEAQRSLKHYWAVHHTTFESWTPCSNVRSVSVHQIRASRVGKMADIFGEVRSLINFVDGKQIAFWCCKSPKWGWGHRKISTIREQVALISRHLQESQSIHQQRQLQMQE
jgi:hypothetical protein